MKFRQLSNVFLMIGLGFLFWGVSEYRKTVEFLETAVAVQGEVRALRQIRGANGRTYRPIIAYTDHTGAQREFEPGYSTNPPAYFEGEKLELLYDPADPKYPLNVRTNDRLGLWFRAGGLSMFGVFFLAATGFANYLYSKGGEVTFGEKSGSPRDGYDF